MAINGKSNIDGNFLAVNGNSNLDGTSPLYRDRPPVRCFYVGKFTEHLPEFLTCPSVESYGRLYVKTEISPFSYYTETRRTTYLYLYQAAIPSRYPDRTAVRKGDAVRIEPRPPSSQQVPLLRAQLADVVSTPSKRRRHPDAWRGRRVQTIVSALYYY